MSTRRITYLDAEAQLGGAFLHPGGWPATELLLDFLAPTSGERILEMGCGPGTTTELVASAPGVSVVALETSTAMLRTARRRIERAGLAGRVRFVRHDLNARLPLNDASCEAAFAESVIALLDPEPVLREAARVLRPGGRLALNERIWRPGLTRARVDEINAVSQAAFGIPAATPISLDRDGWCAMIERAGFQIEEVHSVAEIPPPADGPSVFQARLRRYRHYISRPGLAWHQYRFKQALRRQRDAFDALESYLFFARKP